MKRQHPNNINPTPPSSTTAPPPVSLGKPSLRHRLESYYTLVAPSAISNTTEWKTKFEKIYQKYGGSVQGETALSNKLTKKYGNTVRLLIAPNDEEIRRIASGRGRSRDQLQKLQQQTQNQNQVKKQDESYYEIQPQQQNSAVLLFASPKLDVQEILKQPVEQVLQLNGFDGVQERNATILDNLSKCRRLLPPNDPLYIAPPSNISSSTTTTFDKNNKDAPTASSAATTKKKTSPYALMSTTNTNTMYSTGPLSLLNSIYTSNQRARILIRYVDCIRSTLTGYILAFDKHCNMILRDVDEVYTSRVTAAVVQMKGEGNEGDNDKNWSKGELERRRRMDCILSSSSSPSPPPPLMDRRGNDDNNNNNHHKKKKEIIVKQRHMKQLLVRGDNVVSVWRANEEQCNYQQQQFKKKQRKEEENMLVMVTPGFILPAARQRLRRSEKGKTRKNKKVMPTK